MSMRHTWSALALTMILTVTGMSAQAYEFTGAVKTLPSGAWHHWQEITLQKGDDSVWTPCQRFVTRLRDLTATPVTFSTKECVELSEQLSGVTGDQHDSLPVGQSMWVPYVPVDVTAADIAVLSARAPFDPSAIEAALANVQATMLSKDDVAALIAASATALEAALKQQIEQLRTELTMKQSNNNGMLVARLKALEEAMTAGESVSKTTALAPPAIADKLGALTDQVNELAGLNSQIDAMEERLQSFETDLTQVQTDLAKKADSATVTALSKRVKILEDKPSDGGATPVTETDWFWWLVALSVVSVVSLGLIGWLFGRTSDTNDTVKDQGDRLKNVEETVNYVLTYNAQQRFVCSELTDDRLNELPVGEPIKLIIKEQGLGAAHPHIHLKKGENPDGSEYLQLIGIENSAGERLDPKQLKGRNTKRFTVIQVFRKIDDVIKEGRVIGVGKDPAHQQQ